MKRSITVFIENEAGSSVKNHFDEERLVHTGSERVARPYPLAYGFIPRTAQEDGDCLDCFVVSARKLRSGDLVRCLPFAAMRQLEAGVEDSNILASPVGESVRLGRRMRQRLVDFVLHVFEGRPDRRVEVGGFGSRALAKRLITRCRRRYRAMHRHMDQPTP